MTTGDRSTPMIRAAALALAALAAASCGERPPSVTVEQARLVAAGSAAAGYMRLVNAGGADRLVAVDAPGIGPASLHSTSMDGGVMRMRARPGGLEIGALETLELKPMGNHLMVEGIARPLVPGSEVELVLRFERQGAVRAIARVEAPGASGRAH